jgi:hypothetical protein
MMNPPDNIERAIAQLHITTRPEVDRRILDDASAVLRAGVRKQPFETDAGAARMARIIKIAGAALVAAAILIALALLFKGLPTGEPTIGEIHKAFARAENTCVSTFQAGTTVPVQQVWTSRTLDVRLLKVGSGDDAQFTLWDTPIGVKMIKPPASDSVRTEAITGQMLAQFNTSLPQTSSLFPFSDVNSIPKNAQWRAVDQSQVATRIPETKVYELTWTAPSGTSAAMPYRKCRLFVDARTLLPRRAEWYAKSRPKDPYTFETFSVVSYPTQSEIQGLIRDTFGPRPGQPSEPEYIGTPGADR